MNVLVGIAALGLLVLRPAQDAPVTPGVELTYRSRVGAVVEWRTTLSGDVEYFDVETKEPAGQLVVKGTVDTDSIGVAPEAEGERRELLHVRRMEVSMAADGEPPETMIMTRDFLQNGAEVLRASETPELDTMLAALFDQPNHAFRLSPRGVDAALSLHGKAADDEAIAGMNVATEFALLHPVLPEGPVAVGATWKGRRAISSEYDFAKPVIVDFEYELAGVADGIATLRAKGRLEATGPLAAQSEEGEVEISDLVFAHDSEIRFRVAEGVVASAECSFRFDARIDSDAEGEEPVLLKSSSRIELDRRPPVAAKEKAK